MRSTRQKLKLLRSMGNRSNAHSHTNRTHQHQTTSTTPSIVITKVGGGGGKTETKNTTNTLTSSECKRHQINDNTSGCFILGNNTLIQHPIKHSPLTSTKSLTEKENHKSISNLSTISMESVITNNSELRSKVYNICKDYLNGTWKQIEQKDLIIKRIKGGLSNYLYHCSLPNYLQPLGSEPSQVLIRFYGQVHGEDALESIITESVIFALLSERKLGPMLYGIFPGGRIEQFLPARPLLTHELQDVELSNLIAEKTAQIHSMNIPICKKATWLWGTMDRWMTTIQENLSNDETIRCNLIKFSQYNLHDELEWLKNFLPKIGSPVVFSHNDLQEGNILVRPEYKKLEEKLILIDFEYCSYNFRGFDLANHFCEWSYNYNVELYPNFMYNPENLPSHQQKVDFVRQYVKILKMESEKNFVNFETESVLESSLFNEEHILMEIEAFSLASHFFWCLWAIVNGLVSKIPFGYWEYGISRIEAYKDLKKKYL